MMADATQRTLRVFESQLSASSAKNVIKRRARPKDGIIRNSAVPAGRSSRPPTSRAAPSALFFLIRNSRAGHHACARVQSAVAAWGFVEWDARARAVTPGPWRRLMNQTKRSAGRWRPPGRSAARRKPPPQAASAARSVLQARNFLNRVIFSIVYSEGAHP